MLKVSEKTKSENKDRRECGVCKWGEWWRRDVWESRRSRERGFSEVLRTRGGSDRDKCSARNGLWISRGECRKKRALTCLALLCVTGNLENTSEISKSRSHWFWTRIRLGVHLNEISLKHSRQSLRYVPPTNSAPSTSWSISWLFLTGIWGLICAYFHGFYNIQIKQ